MYDKGVEQGTHPPGIRWRLELEAKQDLAEQLWEQYKSQTDVPEWCYASLAAQWKSSGCSWVLPEPGRPLAACVPGAKPVASAVQLGAWLRTTVAPTIPRYLTVYEVSDLLDVLGISHLAQPIPRSPDDQP